MSYNVETGKKCPQCGAEGDWYGEHEAVVRNIEVGRVNDIKRNIVDVGWRCWNCGHEWGFELVKVLGESGPDPSIRAAAEEIAKRMKEQRSEAER